MTMEIDALYAGLPMRNSLDPCTNCSEWKEQAERVHVLREALEIIAHSAVRPGVIQLALETLKATK